MSKHHPKPELDLPPVHVMVAFIWLLFIRHPIKTGVVLYARMAKDYPEMRNNGF